MQKLASLQGQAAYTDTHMVIYYIRNMTYAPVAMRMAQVYYGDILPPVGSQQISYARFMDLVQRKRVKRVVLMSDGKVAMVEVPVEGYASKLDEARYDRKDEECAAQSPLVHDLGYRVHSPIQAPVPCMLSSRTDWQARGALGHAASSMKVT